LRYSSTEGGDISSGTSSKNQATLSATASPAALSTFNNRILQLHAQQFQLLQQQMLEEHLLAQQKHSGIDTDSEVSCLHVSLLLLLGRQDRFCTYCY
jgi:hypothetical protein